MSGLTRSLQEYLAAIYELKASGKKVVRVRDIAAKLSVTMPSVVGALERLKDMGLVEYEKYGYVDLTPKGLEEAKKIVEAEQLFYKFLREVLGLDEETAKRDACMFEHDASDETKKRLALLLEFLNSEPQVMKKLREYLSQHLES